MLILQQALIFHAIHHSLWLFLIFKYVSLLNNYRGLSAPVRAVKRFAKSTTAILSSYSSTSISVTGRCHCLTMPGSGTSTLGCNCRASSTQEPLHRPNELSSSLIWNYIRVNCNRLKRVVRLVLKDNPLQIAEYRTENIISNISRLSSLSDTI